MLRTAMRPTTFKIESLGDEIFDGFTADEEWNGWDCPYFTFEQARKVSNRFNSLREKTGLKDTAFYEEGDDSFVFPVGGNETERFSAIMADGRKYYPVGSFCWIWEEISSDADDDQSF